MYSLAARRCEHVWKGCITRFGTSRSIVKTDKHPQTGSIEYAFTFMGLVRAGPSVNRLMTALAPVDSR